VKPKPKVVRERLTPYVTMEVAKKFRLRCAALSVTASAGATAAIEQWADDTSDRILLLRRLDRLGRVLDRSLRDEGFHSEAFAVFVRAWLAHLPAMGQQGGPVASSIADNRYEQFMKQVVSRVSGGHRFIDDLPQEPIANDAELDAILARANAGKKKDQP
jgi:hypothetical protein